jgi:gluconate 2-dehydrogenase gamma chain
MPASVHHRSVPRCRRLAWAMANLRAPVALQSSAAVEHPASLGVAGQHFDTRDHLTPPFNRREVVVVTASALVMGPGTAQAALIKGGLPFRSGSANPPPGATPGPWQFFRPEEAAAVEAIVDRLIPADALSPGGKDLGCAVFIDRQLAGPYGNFGGYYMKGPFEQGTKEQGPQSDVTPADHYRIALAALDRHCHDVFHMAFADLPDARKDEVIKDLEDDKLKLAEGSGKDFFKQILNDTQQGFFADPVYGGNRDMAAWKMIGFPGAHYDYREWVERHNQPVTLAPVSIKDHPNWSR